jgi:hypothetical protein
MPQTNVAAYPWVMQQRRHEGQHTAVRFSVSAVHSRLAAMCQQTVACYPEYRHCSQLASACRISGRPSAAHAAQLSMLSNPATSSS